MFVLPWHAPTLIPICSLKYSLHKCGEFINAIAWSPVRSLSMWKHSKFLNESTTTSHCPIYPNPHKHNLLVWHSTGCFWPKSTPKTLIFPRVEFLITIDRINRYCHTPEALHYMNVNLVLSNTTDTLGRIRLCSVWQTTILFPVCGRKQTSKN